MIRTKSIFISFLIPFLLLVLHGKAQDSSNISLLDHWEDTTLPASTTFNNTYNEIWGFVKDSNEYAVIGSTMGTHIFNVSDPSNIQLADFIPGAHQGSDIIHRDFHDHNGHLYMVSDEGNSTLQIADLSPLPDSVELVYDSSEHFKNAHNIFIDSSSERLYACDVTTESNATEDLMILDISTPDAPAHLRDYNGTNGFHDIYVRNDTAYGNQGYNGLIVYDMSDANNIQVIGSLPSYTDEGYNHSGWLSSDGDHYVMADETHGSRMKLLDVSDLSNIQEESLFLSSVSNNSIAHNQIIKGDHVYVAHYHDGVYIWDISNPQNPQQGGFYDTYPPSDHNSYRGAWGVYPFLPSGILLASDMQSGLFVFDVSEATSTGIEQKDAQTGKPFHLYPSPAREAIQIKTDEGLEAPLRIRVSDLRGRTLISREQEDAGKEVRIGLEALERRGLYILELRTPEGNYTKKFVKRK